MADTKDQIENVISGLSETNAPIPKVLRPNEIGGLNVYSPTDIEFINILIYGEPGVGKTRLAASASMVDALSPVLLLDVEAGATSISMYPNVHIVRITSYDDFVEVFKDLKTQHARDKKFPYKTVIMDSITEMQKLGMEAVLARTMERAESEGKDKDPDQPDFGDWAKNANQTRRTIRAFRDLPCNTIFTALAQIDTSRPSQPKAKPYLNGKVADEIAAFLDIVVYMYKKSEDEGETIRRVLLTEGTQDIIAKDRSDTLPRFVIDPLFSELYQLINKGELNE